MNSKTLLLLAASLCCCAALHAEEPGFHKIAVQPFADAPKQFVASGRYIDILFQSDSDADSDDIDSFPEPPVIVLDHEAEMECMIEEGGIWARAEVYLSDDERYMLVYEFSGSSGDLVSYDTHTCREIKRVDVSGMHWRIDGNEARLGENCTGREMTSCASFKPLDLRQFVVPAAAGDEK